MRDFHKFCSRKNRNGKERLLIKTVETGTYRHTELHGHLHFTVDLLLIALVFWGPLVPQMAKEEPCRSISNVDSLVNKVSRSFHYQPLNTKYLQRLGFKIHMRVIGATVNGKTRATNIRVMC